MTKQKAIKELAKLGYILTDARKGRSSAEFSKDGRRVVGNPQDLLAEISANTK